MENSFKSSESLRNTANLVKKIDSLCQDIEKALASCFEITGEKVAGHSITLVSKMDTEFVDSVVIALQSMKNHLAALKKGLKTFSSSKDMNKIVDGLRISHDNLQQLLHSNNFFNNTFNLLVSEVQTMIDAVLERVELVPMQAE